METEQKKHGRGKTKENEIIRSARDELSLFFAAARFNTDISVVLHFVPAHKG